MTSDECKAALVAHLAAQGKASAPSQWRRRSKGQAAGAVVCTFEHLTHGQWCVIERPEGLQVRASEEALHPFSLPTLRWSQADLKGAKKLITALREGKGIEAIEASPAFGRHGHALPAWTHYEVVLNPYHETTVDSADPCPSDTPAGRCSVVFRPSSERTLGTGTSDEEDIALDIDSLIRNALPNYFLDRLDEIHWALDGACPLTRAEIEADLDARGFGSRGLLPAALANGPGRPIVSSAAIREAIEQGDRIQLQAWMSAGAFDPRRATRLPQEENFQESWLCWTARHGHVASFFTLFDHARAQGVECEVPDLITLVHANETASSRIWPLLIHRLPTPSVAHAQAWLEAASPSRYDSAGEGRPSSALLTDLSQRFQHQSPTLADQAWTAVTLAYGTSDPNLLAGALQQFQGRSVLLVNALLAQQDHAGATRVLDKVPTAGALATIEDRPALAVIQERLTSATALGAARVRHNVTVINIHADGRQVRQLSCEEQTASDLRALVSALTVSRGPARRPPRP